MDCIFYGRAYFGIVAVIFEGEKVVYCVLYAEEADETGDHCQWKLVKEGAGKCSRWKLIEEGGVVVDLLLGFCGVG